MFSNKKGRILKVRLGYNANSSSIAAIVSIFLLGSAAAVMLINLISAVLFSRRAPQKTLKKGSGEHE